MTRKQKELLEAQQALVKVAQDKAMLLPEDEDRARALHSHVMTLVTLEAPRTKP